MEYPKWVQRAPEIGAVLCLSLDDEQALLDAWEIECQGVADAQAKAVDRKAKRR